MSARSFSDGLIVQRSLSVGVVVWPTQKTSYQIAMVRVLGTAPFTTTGTFGLAKRQADVMYVVCTF